MLFGQIIGEWLHEGNYFLSRSTVEKIFDLTKAFGNKWTK
jgi:hypothetical protein